MYMAEGRKSKNERYSVHCSIMTISLEANDGSRMKPALCAHSCVSAHAKTSSCCQALSQQAVLHKVQERLLHLEAGIVERHPAGIWVHHKVKHHALNPVSV